MIRTTLALALAALPFNALAAPADSGQKSVLPSGTPVITRGFGASTIVVRGQTRVNSPMPKVMSAAERANYRNIFIALRDGRLADAQSSLNTMPPDGLLTATAWAELWLATGGPRPAADTIKAWLAAHSDYPQADRVTSLARQMGVTDLPAPVQKLGLVPVAPTAREKPRASRADINAANFINQAKPLLVADRPSDAEALLDNSSLDDEVRTEWRQRIAWSYYLIGDDAHALALGKKAGGGEGEWAAMGRWVAGLAAFRAHDYADAAEQFARVARAAHSADLASAGEFWAGRAEMANGQPQAVSARLRAAARYNDSFYGILARRALGIEQPPRPLRPDFLTADWKHVADLPAARRAAALAEIGQDGLADRELRQLAITGQPEDHVALTYLAAKLNLPATQFWLAHNAPRGVIPPQATRYPAPDWKPSRGWRVDPSLVYAHALQESRFVTDARSGAGARGIMQLMPGTARQVAASMGVTNPEDRLTDPSFNLECGQTYLEELRDSQWTGGLLLKVIAAYNAGPGSVKRWNEQLRYNDDPLLFLESIPFAETRHYVELVMRNYWMYQQDDGVVPSSLDALAQGMWPRFPGMPGVAAVRDDHAAGALARAD